MTDTDDLICMMCGEPKNDAPTGYEMDEYGGLWNYCRDCDCWTSHPTPAEPLAPAAFPR